MGYKIARERKTACVQMKICAAQRLAGKLRIAVRNMKRSILVAIEALRTLIHYFCREQEIVAPRETVRLLLSSSILRGSKGQASKERSIPSERAYRLSDVSPTAPILMQALTS